jgi:hypothetical protein
MRYTVPLVLAVIVLVVVPVGAEVWFIKPDGTGRGGPTIQAGVDSASSGDIVLLANGTFIGEGNRDVTVSGKTITLISISEDPEKCIVDCQGSESEPHRAMSLLGGTVVEGIKFIDGWMGDGGAIDMGGRPSGAAYSRTTTHPAAAAL